MSEPPGPTEVPEDATRGTSDNRLLDKRAFYSQVAVSDSYDEQRFGGASGQRVNQRELGIVLDLLPGTGRVLDLASGTGRLARALADRGQTVVAADYSPPMAAKTHAMAIPSVIADAFAAPFLAGSFDAVVALRFAFHYRALDPLIAEMRRVAMPGALLVFDTYSWSPRAMIPLGERQWGGVVHVHSRTEVARVASRLGLQVQRAYPCFLFSPYLYRLAPEPLERAFEWLERLAPKALLCRTFWSLSAG